MCYWQKNVYNYLMFVGTVYTAVWARGVGWVPRSKPWKEMTLTGSWSKEWSQNFFKKPDGADLWRCSFISCRCCFTLLQKIWHMWLMSLYFSYFCTAVSPLSLSLYTYDKHTLTRTHGHTPMYTVHAQFRLILTISLHTFKLANTRPLPHFIHAC